MGHPLCELYQSPVELVSARGACVQPVSLLFSAAFDTLHLAQCRRRAFPWLLNVGTSRRSAAHWPSYKPAACFAWASADRAFQRASRHWVASVAQSDRPCPRPAWYSAFSRARGVIPRHAPCGSLHPVCLRSLGRYFSRSGCERRQSVSTCRNVALLPGCFVLPLPRGCSTIELVCATTCICYVLTHSSMGRRGRLGPVSSCLHRPSRRRPASSDLGRDSLGCPDGLPIFPCSVRHAPWMLWLERQPLMTSPMVRSRSDMSGEGSVVGAEMFSMPAPRLRVLS